MALSIRSMSRNSKSVKAMQTAAICIGKIEKDFSLFAVTLGQFSMIDAIQHCLAEMGPSVVSVWTWCIADYELETFEWLLRAGNIKSARLVIDRAGEQQVGKHRRDKSGAVKHEAQGVLMRRWKEKFGADSIRVVHNHAKIATLDNGEFKVVIRGSMNLNHNPRFEQMDLTEGAGAFDLIREIEDSLPVMAENYSRQDVDNATGAHAVFTPEQLIPFTLKGGLKVWAK